ncbi:MAG: 23S rRNA (guanosine(2251)-2'-O)-methyltransferase RlmB [Actinomycetota bacterium]
MSEGRLGGDQVEGRRAVAELLQAGRRRVRAVYVSSGVERDPLVAEIIEAAGRSLRIVTPEKVEHIARSETHQGVVAQCAPLRPAELDDLAAAEDAFLVVLDGVTDPRNLGAIIRTADTAGATGVVVGRHRSAHVSPAVTKAAAGAIEHVPIAVVGGIPAALDRLRRAGCWTVGLDERARTSVHELDLAGERLALVLGAEGRGLARLTRERCDVLVRIPVHGHVPSLNVSAAAAVVLHEVARRRHPGDG